MARPWEERGSRQEEGHTCFPRQDNSPSLPPSPPFPKFLSRLRACSNWVCLGKKFQDTKRKGSTGRRPSALENRTQGQWPVVCFPTDSGWTTLQADMRNHPKNADTKKGSAGRPSVLKERGHGLPQNSSRPQGQWPADATASLAFCLEKIQDKKGSPTGRPRVLKERGTWASPPNSSRPQGHLASGTDSHGSPTRALPPRGWAAFWTDFFFSDSHTDTEKRWSHKESWIRFATPR